MRGFSLVELSIVLVILGLLTGGILSGQSLIHAAEIRSITSDVSRFNAAVNSFRGKYFQLPGDMNNAVKFWDPQAGGTANGTDATCQALDFASPATDAKTCNGDGNGQIGWKEAWRAWQHMANAGLVEGSYSGVPGDAADISYATPGWNTPISKLQAGYTFVYTGTATASVSMFDGDYGNPLRYGSGNGSDENPGLIRAEDAWNIDLKMDDGQPAYGKVRAYKNTQRPNCTSTDVSSTAQYLVQNTTNGCNLVFLSGF